MKINSELNVDDLPGVMRRQITGRQVMFGVAGALTGIVIMIVLSGLCNVPTNYGCYAALPVVFVIVFAGAVNFNGYSGFGWLLKQQEVRLGKRIYVYDSGEIMPEKDGKEAE